jgi:hypothetical protein
MRTHTTQLKTGITRTKEFEKKKLAAYAVNIGTKCGHDCAYATRLIRNVQEIMRSKSNIEKLRILLYPSRLLPEHIEQIRKDDAGVIWLGKD